MNNILPNWSFASNYEFSDLGKIWIVWKPSVQVNIISKSLQMITCSVKLPFQTSEFVVSFIYASNCRKERRLLWSELEATSCSPQLCGLPWIVLGDFNEIISPAEHSRADLSTSTRGMRDFSECLQRCLLSDLHYSGISFTWSNSSVSKKLDRILCNEDWLEAFPESIAVFGKPGISDHSPCCTFLDQLKPPQKRPFRFFAHLNCHPDFRNLVKATWNSLPFHGTRQLVVSKKLKEMKPIIRSFNKENFSEIEKRVQEAFDHLTDCQQESLSTPSLAAAAAEKSAHAKWFTLAKAEDKFLHQRSRVQWSAEGDAGTAFFHRAIRARQAQNHIHYLMENGSIIDTLDGIKCHAVNHFQQLLGGPNVATTSSPADIASVMQVKCSSEAISALAAPFSDLDIEKAFLSLPKNKSPGPDGYPAEFFTANWKVVGRDMIDAVKEFLSTGDLLQQWNATLLILVPKKTTATKITEFRPIACCNTVYKVASKLLANRLKDHLPTLISTSQSAFVPGRLLVENVLLATELVSGYNWKKISKRCMLKVDLQKAFDTLDWNFVLYTLEALDFPLMFRNLIKKCLTTTRFSVAINGEPCGYFKGTRGLRQGDPLSPYLFVLALEVFSQQLRMKYLDGAIGYHPNTPALQVTHLAFADDLMIFADGTTDSVKCIAETMEEFALWSGLRMNKAKTELYTAGLNADEALEISRLGFSIGAMPIRYLGLPLMYRKLRLPDYKPLIDRISANFNCWSARALSFAGRKQLLSSVIYGSINFWTSAFILPKNCIKRIEALCSQFLWGGTETKRSIAKVAWKTVTLPKEEGGLGLRDISRWNKTLCLKLIWRLYTAQDSLWASWVKEYRVKGGNFWAIDASKTTSSTWHSLLSLRGLAAGFLKAKLGNGQQISFWYDRWTPLGSLIDCFGPTGPRELQIEETALVRHACNDEGWLLRGARSQAAEELQLHLTTIPLPSLSATDDSYVWETGGNELQEYSTSKTWEDVRNRATKKSWTRNIWFKGHIPRHAFTVWVAHQDRLPTRARLVGWGMNIPSSCCLCSLFEESRDHLFLRCEVSDVVWQFVLGRLGYSHRGFHSWYAFWEWMGLKDSVVSLTLKRAAAQVTISCIWTERNKRLHDSTSQTPLAISKKIDRIIRDAILGRKHTALFHPLMQEWLRFD
ncbi:uncharacterized protein LOC108839423 [Raphanus sativus]|uniref:Uncharacterized protein LOC108839423 n=1 Tax=Raphanus sativus TaxID=3726 RepID=A0A6J0M6H2_RAPSA|nr:uncharacterized protein LOC108839423 [Raphanus sativus]